MEITWTVKYITEFIGTALLVLLGNGTVANVSLKGTKGNASGFLTVAFGYGFALMLPALMFGDVSGNHINPGITIGLAASGLFPWKHVAQYIIAQFLGAMFAQLVLVAVYNPFFKKTDSADAILGSFSSGSALDDNTSASRKGAIFNGLVTEFVGSFVLFFGALALTKNFFGHTHLSQVEAQAVASGYPAEQVTEGLAQVTNQFFNGTLAVAHLALGFLLVTLILGLGGPTGSSLNPARDFGPRLVHAFLPKSVIGEAKGDSKFWYSWVPVVAPILAGLAAVALFKYLYL